MRADVYGKLKDMLYYKLNELADGLIMRDNIDDKLELELFCKVLNTYIVLVEWWDE